MLYGIECNSWADIGSDYQRFSSNSFTMALTELETPTKQRKIKIRLDEGKEMKI